MCTHLAALTGMYAIVETGGFVTTNTTQYCRPIEFCGKRMSVINIPSATSNYCPELFIT
jgi:hypothetical protein